MKYRALYNFLSIEDFLAEIRKQVSDDLPIMIYKESDNSISIYASDGSTMAVGNLPNKYITYYTPKTKGEGLIQLRTGTLVVV